MGGVLVALSFRQEIVPPNLTSFALWVAVVGVAGALAQWGRPVVAAAARVRPFVDFLDLQWLYRAAWQGAENLLGIVRVTADVVEGSGSVLWSVLILLLVLMVVTNR
jgi:hypothetical protein